MSEAVITRGGLGGGSVSLNDSTYQQLGLNNKSSFDDVILALAYKSNDYASIFVTVLNPDGKPVPNASVRMIDTGGVNINYTTDKEGKCIFKTNAGSANIIDEHGFYDLWCNQEKVDCPVGFTKFITLQRNTYGNGHNFPIIATSQSIKISNFTNVADITVLGAGGSGGYSAFHTQSTYDNAYSHSINLSGGGAGNRGILTTSNAFNISNQTIPITIGVAQSLSYGDSDTENSYYAGRGTAVASFTPPAGYGVTGGTTAFGSFLSAAGGAGGMNANSGDNAGLPDTHSNKVWSNYPSYGYGGDSSWGRSAWASYSKHTAEVNDKTRYYTTVSVSVSLPKGGNGMVEIKNIQYFV